MVKWKKLLITLGICAVIPPVLCLAFYILYMTGSMEALLRTDCVVPNYKWCVGIIYRNPVGYEYIQSKYGEANKIETAAINDEVTAVYVTHDMLCFKFSTNDLDDLANTDAWTLHEITTQDPKHRFGKARIHVGSTRDEVILAYSEALPIKEAALGDEYWDGSWEVLALFTYDEDDIVNSISFTTG